MQSLRNWLKKGTWVGVFLLFLSVGGCGSFEKKISPNEKADGSELLEFNIVEGGKIECWKIPEKEKIPTDCYKNGVMLTYGLMEEIFSDP